MKTANFTVHGMHCDGCAQIVQSVLERREGVQTCAVSFADGTARVLFDPVRVDECELQTAIEKAGYQVEPHRNVRDATA
ncbi:MAG: heavy-metal-associated domain-containing protein [Betaproteobacteria bacterium]|nr:heavy-metal-associated domain-containing protein [Betaproteobacteria bacterium]